MKNEWIKLPNGKFVRKHPDPLQYIANQQDVLLPTSFTEIPMATDGHESTSSEPNYSTGAFNMNSLYGVEVTVIGNGSVGSYFAYAMGPACLRTNLIDHGIIQTKHIQAGRTRHEAMSLGERKVVSMKYQLERDFPGSRVQAYPYHTKEIPDSEFITMFRSSYLVVLAIDDPEEIIRLSSLVYPITEMIQVAMHRGGDSGHIVLSVPFSTPCLMCTLGIDSARDIQQLDSEPANSADIASVAQQAARMGLDILYSKVTGQHITRWDTSKNLVYLANTKEALSPDGPGLHFEGSQKRHGCPVCNNL